MKIITFGSCLSRYVADMWLTLFEGELLNSVYHNRIDAYVANFVTATERGEHLPDYKWLKSALDIDASKSTQVNEIILNQYPKRLGLHHLPKDMASLTKTLHKQQVDLIILDNYVDIGGRLLTQIDNPDRRIFCNYQFINNWQEHFTLGNLLNVEEAVEHWHATLQHLRQLQPKARLVFLHFPFNAYGQSARQLRSQAFAKALTLPDGLTDAWILPPYPVPESHQTEELRHFQPAQYAMYAGIIHQLLYPELNNGVLLKGFSRSGGLGYWVRRLLNRAG